MVESTAPTAGDWARLFGQSELKAEPTSVSGASRFRLLGVVAPKGASIAVSSGGVALISVDGAPPKAVKVGARIEDGVHLLSVARHSANIKTKDGASLSLQLDTSAPMLSPDAQAMAPRFVPPPNQAETVQTENDSTTPARSAPADPANAGGPRLPIRH
ncbi:hypothetical protein ACG0Z6_01295 [Roseateles sp. BYS180W]|uniref:Type II secretion system protein GspC N-terminal domain-containing protein n=1 Tax=Roseateles rivi TaxID=3299028 RepID=A0ABW7FRB4_9BURK